MKNMVVAYLDILGYRNYVSENPDGANRLIDDWCDIIYFKSQDAITHPPSSYSMSKIRTAAEKVSIDAFDYFLPSSDSVFIISKEPSKFIYNLSNFLKECFDYRSHEYSFPLQNTDDIRKIKLKDFSISRSGVKNNDVEEIWYPLLFRGGIDFGQVQAKKVKSRIELKDLQSHIAFGQAVVKAVSLEETPKLKGPRILCSESFKNEVKGSAENYIGKSKYTKTRFTESEIFWPMSYFEDCDEYTNVLGSVLAGPLNLWAQFAGSSESEHYVSFLKLIVESAFRKYPGKEKEIEEDVLKKASNILQSSQSRLLKNLLF